MIKVTLACLQHHEGLTYHLLSSPLCHSMFMSHMKGGIESESYSNCMTKYSDSHFIAITSITCVSMPKISRAELPAELAQLPQKYFQLAGELAEL